VNLVGLGEKEESGDAGVEDLVVVGLSSESEVGEEHVDVVSPSASEEEKEGKHDEDAVSVSFQS